MLSGQSPVTPFDAKGTALSWPTAGSADVGLYHHRCAADVGRDDGEVAALGWFDSRGGRRGWGRSQPTWTILCSTNRWGWRLIGRIWRHAQGQVLRQYQTPSGVTHQIACSPRDWLIQSQAISRLTTSRWLSTGSQLTWCGWALSGPNEENRLPVFRPLVQHPPFSNAYSK